VSFLGTLSLVKGEALEPYCRRMAQFAVAFTVSSCVIFAVASGVGYPSHILLPGTIHLALVVAVLATALALDARSLRRKAMCPLTARRQTPKVVYYEHGPGRAAVVWGLDAGLVFTTFRMSAISWALLLLGVLGSAPWWTGLGYAAGFVVPLCLGCTFSRRLGDGTTVAVALGRRTAIARWACVATLALAVTVSAIQAGRIGGS
jgi:hypothetical protein